MRYRETLYRVDEKVAVITLNRPDKLNAWTTRMAEEIQDAVMTAAADDAVNVIVITGAGRGFSAGADMSVLQDLSDGGGKKADKAEQPKPTPQDAVSYTHLTLPTICSV